jgi:hypothetical protein
MPMCSSNPGLYVYDEAGRFCYRRYVSGGRESQTTCVKCCGPHPLFPFRSRKVPQYTRLLCPLCYLKWAYARKDKRR